MAAVFDWVEFRNNSMKGTLVSVLMTLSMSPMQKRMTRYIASPMAPLINIVKNMALGTLMRAFCTSSAIVLLALQYLNGGNVWMVTHMTCAVVSNEQDSTG